MPVSAAQQAIAILRDESQFKWYVIPLFAHVAYAVDVEHRNWNLMFAGLACWCMDRFERCSGLAVKLLSHASWRPVKG